MGVQARLVLWCSNPQQARQGAAAAFERLARVDAALSDWLVDGELARLEARAGSGSVPVSADLFDCLARALEIARATGGAFDPTLGRLTRLWRAARASGVAPTPDALAEARAHVGWRGLELDPDARGVRLPAGVQLDLGGIGKGYGADRALETLHARGIERALVGMSGDHVAGAPPPGRRGWTLGAEAHPAGRVVLAHAGVATSGDSEQFFELDGVRHSHVLDPRTGQGVVARPWVTVVARDGATADALASALSVLGPEGVDAVRAAFPEVEVHFADRGEARRHGAP